MDPNGILVDVHNLHKFVRKPLQPFNDVQNGAVLRLTRCLDKSPCWLSHSIAINPGQIGLDYLVAEEVNSA